jgi:hypothetical protein
MVFLGNSCNFLEIVVYKKNPFVCGIVDLFSLKNYKIMIHVSYIRKTPQAYMFIV